MCCSPAPRLPAVLLATARQQHQGRAPQLGRHHPACSACVSPLFTPGAHCRSQLSLGVRGRRLCMQPVMHPSSLWRLQLRLHHHCLLQRQRGSGCIEEEIARRGQFCAAWCSSCPASRALWSCRALDGQHGYQSATCIIWTAPMTSMDMFQRGNCITAGSLLLRTGHIYCRNSEIRERTSLMVASWWPTLSVHQERTLGCVLGTQASG